MPLRRVCVFCGSSTGTAPEYRHAAEMLAREMTSRGIGLVFGGGCVGLMGVVADAILAAGGHAIGVIPHAMVARELAHLGLQDLRVVTSMHERIVGSLRDPTKQRWFGGPLCGPPRWRSSPMRSSRCRAGSGPSRSSARSSRGPSSGCTAGRPAKAGRRASAASSRRVATRPCGLLNVRGFYDPLLAQIDRAVEDGFIKDSNRNIVVADTSPAGLLDRLAEPPARGERIWLTADET